MVSNQTGESLWIYSADCIPIFFADPRKRFTAAVHAGWRGISKGILRKTLDKLESLGSNRNEIIIALGPAISKNKYEVELEVLQAT